MNKEKCEEFLKTGKKNGKPLKVGGEAYTRTMKECEEILKKVTIEDVEQDVVIPKRRKAEPVVEEARVISTKLGGRLIVIVQDTTNYGLKCHNWYINETCQNFVFEYSTGTSNPGENFRNTFVPILGVANDGYMYKTFMRKMDTEKRIFPIVFKYVYYQLELNQHTKSCAVIVEDFLRKFLEKFSCWKELQLSAALSGDTGIWNKLAVGRVLKEFVLNYDFSYDKKHIKDDVYENNTLPDPEQKYSRQINTMITSPFLKKRNSRLNNLTYDIPSIETLPDIDTTTKEFAVVLNKWLFENNALCKDLKNQDPERDIARPLNPRKHYIEKEHIRVSTAGDTDTVYSGWERCN